MPKQNLSCPICKYGPSEAVVSDGAERIRLTCPRCGEVSITATAAQMAQSRDLGSGISAWLRSHAELGVAPVEINASNLDSIGTSLPSYQVSDKFLLLLQAIERRTRTPGEKITLETNLDFPICWASSGPEFIYLTDGLISRKLLDGQTRPDKIFATITPEGWEYLEQHRQHKVASNQVFVAMSFSESMKPIWEQGIKPAISQALFTPYRIDSTPHNERIDAKIIAEIKNSRFVVADVTEQKAGVYFEAGFAIGLGIPVIWSVNRAELDSVHFDTRQYNHIVWESSEELKGQLYDFIRAIVGTGAAT